MKRRVESVDTFMMGWKEVVLASSKNEVGLRQPPFAKL